MTTIQAMPSMDDFRYEDVVGLLRSGKHAPLLGAYFGEEQYRDLQRLANSPAKARRADDSVVYLLPGVMGSKIGRGDGAGSRLLWLNPSAIAAGSLLELARPQATAMQAVGVMLGGYLKLRLALEHEGFEVRFHSFDWRADLEIAAQDLLTRITTENPSGCALIGHSMGGLVARIALHLANDKRIARVIQLGTPNGGAYAPLQALRAVYPTVRKIAALDPNHTAEELAREVFLTLPGLYQLLPSEVPPASIDLLDATVWPQDDLQPDVAALSRARDIRKLLAPADERCLSICGIAQETITAVRSTAEGFEYTYTRNGDGTVPASMSSWPGARTWYSPTPHGALTLHDPVIAATAELLATNDCRSLPATAPAINPAVTRVVTDRQLRTQVTGKVRWENLPIPTRRLILEPVLSAEFLNATEN